MHTVIRQPVLRPFVVHDVQELRLGDLRVVHVRRHGPRQRGSHAPTAGDLKRMTSDKQRSCDLTVHLPRILSWTSCSFS